MPLPEHAPAAIPADGNTVMSWHWSVRLVLLGVVAVVAAAPQPGQHAGSGVGKHGRTVDDPRAGRIVDRDLDDVDAEQRGAVVAGRLVDAAGQLLFFANRRRAGVVDDDLAVIAGTRDNGMRVGSAASLHGTHLHRSREVADVENSNPAEALVADVFVDSLQTAVEPAARLFHRRDQEIADDGDVALSARTDHRAQQFWCAAFLQSVDVETVIAAGDQHVAGKRHVGVGETQQR